MPHFLSDYSGYPALLVASLPLPIMVIIDASNAITNNSLTVDDDGGGIDGENGHTITAGTMADTISNGGDATLLLNSPPPPTMKDIANSQYDPSAAPSQDSWGRELASSSAASTDETSKPQFDANGTTAPAVADSLLSMGGPNGDDDDDDDDAIDAYVDDDNTKTSEVGYGDTAILRSPIEEDTTIAPINDGRAAYSAQTANAIALILQGRASQINQHEDGGGGGDNGNTEEEKDTTMTSSTTRGGTEISLGDRTAALLSVYSDYVRENITNDDGPPKNPFINDTIDDDDNVNIHGDDKLCIQMKEELKEVTFDRFMSGLETQSYVDNYEDDDDYYDSDDDVEYKNFEEDPNLNGTDWSTPAVVTTHNTNSSSNGEMTKKRQRQRRRQRRRRIPPPPPPKKRLEYYRIPTAASTIASFRLRADVALSAVTQKVNTVVRVTRGITRTTIGSLEVVDDGQSAVIDDDEDDEDDNDISSQRTDLEYGESSGDAIYGLHILERDMTRKKQSMKRKIGSNDSDDNNDDNGLDTFYETCDELGMTPKTHPGLHHFYRHHHHHKNGHGFSSIIHYQYPMFRSKRVRRCILYSMTLILFGLICVALVSSISNGFETIRLRNTPPLPEDWRDELDWSVKQKDEWEKNHAQNVNNIGDIHTTPIMNMTLLYHKISASHRPVWYDRSTGWTGRTWDEAISFCNAHDNNIPCPYEVYCPNEKTLLSGIMDTDGVSWAPIMNAHNEWVQVGSGGTECALYSLFHNGQSPTWGEDGSSSMINTEANTRHIMCCREHPLLVEDSSSVDWVDSSSGTVSDANYGVIRPDGPPAGGDVNYPQSTVQDDISSVTSSSSSSSSSDEISRKYNPMWFDRESGWMGKTYQESLDFCANVWSGYIPCPYDAYCPGGRGKLLDGRIHEEGESWSAVIDDANDWVQVGVNGVCNLYSETELEKPSWGTTGKSNEEITRHIMCCQGAPYVDGLSLTLAGATEVDLSNSSSGTEVDSTGVMIPTQPMTEKEVAILDTLHPVWFSTIDGYTGTTYDDARVFCESNSHSNDSVGGGTYHICPLSAYCPNGPISTKPLYLQQDAFDGVQWAPISDDLNAYVMVGKIEDEDPLTCVTYSQMFSRDPVWGIDGSRPELKKHLLCCEDYTGYAFTPPKDEIASLTTEEETTSNGMTEMKMTQLEILIQNLHRPMWFNNEEGWQGASYNDGQAFCESIPHGDGTLHLCPLDAYCPNGPRESKPLYLQMDAFDGDQWAPISDSFNSWVNIGKLEVEDPLTCLTHIEIFGHNPTWGLDGSKPELKDNILCCVDMTDSDIVNNNVSAVNSDSQSESNTEVSHEGSAMVDVGKHAVDASIMNTFNPAWFSAARGGWDGGSHDDAVAFCEKFTGSHGKSIMELCPYHAYCPQGPSMPVVGGHDVIFEEEGEQWAPIYGQQNHWVMIGNGGANVSSLCQSHVKLTGEEPLWGLDWSHKEMKKYVMCCSPSST